ncbi:glycosyltransferase family 87 protein [Rhodococcus globerulus]|uniref:Glycosyltransferase family 87 protein n=1 Tax=Rhodococcus globerulus TaxID=33008 RepID=A0ABU4BUS5_RHOGO|nr:glycosyltransferase family 87 protein [Rhodococcus globerulus]MDV6267972.1 glycosyltransferase family 87 protein [Rhodococcus globerulus]
MLTAACVVLAYLVYVVRAVEPVDFLVYRYAVEKFASGGDIYAGNLLGPMIESEGMPFTYTPFAVLLLWPTAFFDWWTAYLLWSLLCILLVAWTVARFTPRWVRLRPLVMAALLIGVSVTPTVSAHISFGQVNLLLMALVLFDITRDDNSILGRYFPRGLLIGVATAIKLTPGLFIVYFVVTRQWRLAIWSSVGAAAATVAAALVDPALSRTFWTEVVWSLSGRVDLTGEAIASSGNGSLQGTLAALGSWTDAVVMPLIVLVGAAALWIARRIYLDGRSVDAALVIGLSAPILSPISWIHHWVYLVPAAVTILFRLRSRCGVAGFVAALVVVYCGPSMGQQLMDASVLLVPVGVILREGFILVSAAAIVALWQMRPRPDTAFGENSAFGENDSAPESEGNQGPNSIEESGVRTRS